jgi:hypothetical protein
MRTQNLFFAFAAFFLVFGATQALAEKGEHEHKPYIGSKAFERMKQLVGVWEGSMDMGKGPMKSTVSYRLTSADSAIVETVFEGAPHEMTSVYHDDSKRLLTMTHYCAEHNQPKLTLTSMVDNKLTMDLSTDSDIGVTRETHIHSATIQFDGNDKMTQQWISFENGKKNQVVEIAFKRVR